MDERRHGAPHGRGDVVSGFYRNGRTAEVGDEVISANGLDQDLFTIRLGDDALRRRKYWESAGVVAMLDGPLVYVRPNDGGPVYLAAAGDLYVAGDS